MPPKPAFIKTIVTTELQRKIAGKYGALCYDVLTGFKYIADQIRKFEMEEDGPKFIIGGEESYGFLFGDKVRDKDAVSTAILAVEMTLHLAGRGISIAKRLDELYRDFGYYEEILISRVFKGEKGASVMERLIEKLRNDPPSAIAGIDVREIKDYRNGIDYTVTDGKYRQTVSLPAANVLQYILADDSVISVRPSGTEPKIKFYGSFNTEVKDDIEASKDEIAAVISRVEREIEEMVDNI